MQGEADIFPYAHISNSTRSAINTYGEIPIYCPNIPITHRVNITYTYSILHSLQSPLYNILTYLVLTFFLQLIKKESTPFIFVLPTLIALLSNMDIAFLNLLVRNKIKLGVLY